MMLTATLALIDQELANLRHGCPAGAVGRADAVAHFCAFSQTLATGVTSDVNDWQERMLARHPRLESAISWGTIDAATLGEALEQGAVQAAVKMLERWAPALGSAVITTPLSEVEMAVVATATQRVRDVADALDCGAHDDPGVGPCRINLPQFVFDLAEGTRVRPHPSVYIAPVVEYCEALFWTILPSAADVWNDPGVEDAVLDGVRPAAVAMFWLHRNGLLPRLAGAINRHLEARRVGSDDAFGDLMKTISLEQSEKDGG